MDKQQMLDKIAKCSDDNEIAETAYSLGTLYIKYDGDYETGIKYHKLAESKGKQEAIWALIDYYKNIAKNYSEMKLYYEKLIIRYNCGAAANSLGEFYETEEKNTEMALAFYNVGDALGNFNAKHNAIRIQHGHLEMIEDKYSDYV